MARTRRNQGAPQAKKQLKPDINDQLRSLFAYASPGVEPDWATWANTAPIGLDARERSKLLLAAANGEALSSDQWNQLIGYSFDHGSVRVPNDARLVVCKYLNEIATDFAAAAKRYESEFRAAARVFVKVSIDGQILVTTMRSALIYGIWLFLSKPELGRALCFCHYRHCGKFFFEIRGGGKRGRPQRLYCDNPNDHGRLEDDASAAKRMDERRNPKRK